MFRHDLLMSTIRFYEKDEPSEFEDYCAVCTVVWETKDVIWLKGFMGKVGRKHFRQMLKWLVENEIKTIKAYRSPRHIIPLASMNEEGYCVISVKALVDRFSNKDNNGKR